MQRLHIGTIGQPHCAQAKPFCERTVAVRTRAGIERKGRADIALRDIRLSREPAARQTADLQAGRRPIATERRDKATARNTSRRR